MHEVIRYQTVTPDNPPTTIARRLPNGKYQVLTVETREGTPQERVSNLKQREGKKTYMVDLVHLASCLLEVGLTTVPILEFLKTGNPNYLAPAFVLTILAVLNGASVVEKIPLLTDDRKRELDAIQTMLVDESSSIHNRHNPMTIPDLHSTGYYS